MIGRKTIRNFVCQWYMYQTCNAMAKILYGNSEKSFLECKWNGFKKRLPALFPCEFFHVCIIYKYNRTVFLIQFEINLRCLVSFSKSWNCMSCFGRSSSCNFSFLKNSLMQINSKLNSKPYDYLFKLNTLRTKIAKLWVSRSQWCNDRGVLNLHHNSCTMIMTSHEKFVSSQPTVTWCKSTNQKIGIRTVYEIWTIKTSTL